MEEKMEYQDFLSAIKTGLQKRLGNSYKISVEKVIKEDGNAADAVCMSKPGEMPKPQLYLNAYYSLYRQEMSTDEILTEITEVYQWNENRKKKGALSLKCTASGKDITAPLNNAKSPLLSFMNREKG